MLAKIIEASEDPRAAARVIPWSVLLALTHAMAVLFVALAAALLLAAARPTRRRLGSFALGLSGCALVIVPWLLARALPSSGTPGGDTGWHLDNATASEKMAGLFAFSLDNLRGAFGEGTAAMAFALLLLGPVAFVCDREDGARASRR